MMQLYVDEVWRLQGKGPSPTPPPVPPPTQPAPARTISRQSSVKAPSVQAATPAEHFWDPEPPKPVPVVSKPPSVAAPTPATQPVDPVPYTVSAWGCGPPGRQSESAGHQWDRVRKSEREHEGWCRTNMCRSVFVRYGREQGPHLDAGLVCEQSCNEPPPGVYESSLNNIRWWTCICGMQVYVTTSDVSGGAFDGSVFIVLQVRVACLQSRPATQGINYKQTAGAARTHYDC